VSKSSFASLAQRLLGLLLLALLLGHAGGYWELPGVGGVERKIYDVRLLLFAPAQPETRIVMLDIDERALTEYGRWPWSRARLAELIDQSFVQQGALLLGLDLILAEPDDSSGLSSLQALAQGPLRNVPGFARQLQALTPRLDHDGRLAEVLSKHAVVLGFHYSDAVDATSSGTLPAPALRATAVGEPLNALRDWRAYRGNLERLQRATPWGGFLNALADRDGITRRVPVLARHGELIHVSLPMAMAQAVTGATALIPEFDAAGKLGALRMETPRGVLRIPTDAHGNVLLPYRARAGLLPQVSAADVLAGRLPAQSLKGKLVLLGSSAPGLTDLHATPLAQTLPGAALHAMLLTGLLNGSVAATPSYTAALQILQLLVPGLLLLLLLPRLGWWQGLTLSAACMTALLGLNAWAWQVWRENWPPAAPLLLVLGLYSLQVFFGQFAEALARRRLATLFRQYVPPELVALMSRDPQRYSMAGRSAELSVLFADVRGFTTLSERLPPHELAALMNRYFSVMTDIVRAHRGTLDKYVGDALMAFWGAPVDDPAHALHAVQAALAMQAALPALNEEFAARGWQALRVTIGINTGTMVVGDMGSRHRRAYTVLGDAVNIAARLQELSGKLEVPVVIGPDTRAALADWPCRELDQVVIRGGSERITIYEALAPAASAEHPRS